MFLKTKRNYLKNPNGKVTNYTFNYHPILIVHNEIKNRLTTRKNLEKIIFRIKKNIHKSNKINVLIL
ncbi:hypothetical protein IO90_09570 [Chryseobacterium sp. FH1]|nr:hypothetical protein IO90_09570 [Chryseobacterium sp. FH1]